MSVLVNLLKYGVSCEVHPFGERSKPSVREVDGKLWLFVDIYVYQPYLHNLESTREIL